MTARVAISVSWGRLDDANYTESTHLLSYAEEEMTTEQAKQLHEFIVKIVQKIKNSHTEQPIFGIYKEEQPQTDTRH